MSPIQQMGNLSPGHVSPNRMPSPVQNPGLRQAWSGDPHPALAQVPRTPQQILHLQRLQMQRQQVEGGAPVDQNMPGSTAGVMMSQGGQLMPGPTDVTPGNRMQMMQQPGAMMQQQPPQ